MKSLFYLELKLKSPSHERMVIGIWEFALPPKTNSYRTREVRNDRLILSFRSVLQVCGATPLSRVALGQSVNLFCEALLSSINGANGHGVLWGVLALDIFWRVRQSKLAPYRLQIGFAEQGLVMTKIKNT